jgi:Tol biopolymer transport system component
MLIHSQYMMKNKRSMPVNGNGEKGDNMERGFVRIIMAVVFSVFITVSLSACGDCDNICENDNNGVENESEESGGEEESLSLPGVITLDSVSSDGNEGNGSTWDSSISADGRYVAFRSYASNLVANDNNGVTDIFVRDRLSGETTRVSVDLNGNEANGNNYQASISADGRYVAFKSYASNLVANDNNGVTDVVVHDRLSGETTRVSVDSNGNEGNGNSHQASISADGRYVAFNSWANNLVANDNNNRFDIFVHDRQSGETTRVSIDSNGNEANNESLKPSISVDGRYVAFYTLATNLVANDNNRHYDIFVHDRQSGETTRVSVDSNGNEANNESLKPSISADGRYVAFESRATNLVANDNNGYKDIFVHDRQSGETTRVSVDSNGNEANSQIKDPSISADGRYITFFSQATNFVTLDYLCGCHIYTAPVP